MTRKERKISIYTKPERGQNCINMFGAVSYRISATGGLSNEDIFLFRMTQSEESGQFQGWLCSWTVSWRTQMFFIFVLGHPQRIGNFFCYSCKMAVGVPDVICRQMCPCPAKKRRCFLLCISVYYRGKPLRDASSWLLLRSIHQDWFTSPRPDRQRLWGRCQQRLAQKYQRKQR